MPPTGTYVQLTRDEFEDWLTRDLGFPPSDWRLKPGRGGVYQLFLSPTVAIEINSTTGAQDAVMDRGDASMSMWLASRVNGKVLNRKAMERSHFKRTKNWRKTWKEGIDSMKAAYLGAKDFYDRMASIEDLDTYKRDTIALIRRDPNWQSDTFLSDLHDKVQRGSILTEKQQAAVERTVARIDQRQTPPAPPAPPAEDARLPALRELWVRARAAQDEWTMGFAKSIAETIKAGRSLTPRQIETVESKAQQYNVQVRQLTASQRVALRHIAPTF